MMAKPLRIGTLGLGRIVQRGLLPAIDGCKHAVLAAVASQRAGVAEQFASQRSSGGRDLPRAFESYEALLACDEVDAVYVPCRGDAHARWTIAAAEAGKHVLCEKPLARDRAEAESMREACSGAGVVLSEAFMYRHHPRSRRAIELVRGGAIGQPRVFAASFSFRIDPGDWRLDPSAGGGAVWDVGCYGINFARWVAGQEPTSVTADCLRSPSGVDLTTRVGLTFAGGMLAVIDCSFDTVYRCRAEIAGTQGRIELPDAFLPVGEAPLYLMSGEGGDSGSDGTRVVTERFPGEDPYAHQMRHFVDSVAAGRLLEPGEDGVENTAVCRAAVDAALSASE